MVPWVRATLNTHCPEGRRNDSAANVYVSASVCVCVCARECSVCAVGSICAVLMQTVINGAVTSVQTSGAVTLVLAPCDITVRSRKRESGGGEEGEDC